MISRAKPRVLLAARPVARHPFHAALGADADIVEAETLDEAVQYLTKPDEPKLVCCTVYFDESRMFDLLRHVRWQERHRATPVVCVLTAEFTRHAIAAEGLEIAVKALGGTSYLDLKAIGDTEARRVIDDLLVA